MCVRSCHAPVAHTCKYFLEIVNPNQTWIAIIGVRPINKVSGGGEDFNRANMMSRGAILSAGCGTSAIVLCRTARKAR